MKAISMDFWKPFVSTAEELLPNAAILHDKFHIMKYLNEAVNKVRVGEHKWRRKQEEATLRKYLWLKKLENFIDKDKEKWATLKLDQLEVGKAWNLKELGQLRCHGEFWTCDEKESARKMFTSWYLSATHSGLEWRIRLVSTVKLEEPNSYKFVIHSLLVIRTVSQTHVLPVPCSPPANAARLLFPMPDCNKYRAAGNTLMSAVQTAEHCLCRRLKMSENTKIHADVNQANGDELKTVSGGATFPPYGEAPSFPGAGCGTPSPQPIPPIVIGPVNPPLPEK